MILDVRIIRRFGRKMMNLIPPQSGRLCCGKALSNRDIGKRFEESRGFAAPPFVFAILLAVIINNPAAAQSQQTTPVTVSQAVQEAVGKNLGLLAERYNLTIADAHIVTARLRPNPVLSLYTDLQPWLGNGATELNQTGPPESGIRTDFIIERGQKRLYRIQVAEGEHVVGEWQV